MWNFAVRIVLTGDVTQVALEKAAASTGAGFLSAGIAAALLTPCPPPPPGEMPGELPTAEGPSVQPHLGAKVCPVLEGTDWGTAVLLWHRGCTNVVFEVLAHKPHGKTEGTRTPTSAWQGAVPQGWALPQWTLMGSPSHQGSTGACGTLSKCE